jgi:hypothetical protein
MPLDEYGNLTANGAPREQALQCGVIEYTVFPDNTITFLEHYKIL